VPHCGISLVSGLRSECSSSSIGSSRAMCSSCTAAYQQNAARACCFVPKMVPVCLARQDSDGGLRAGARGLGNHAVGTGHRPCLLCPVLLYRVTSAFRILLRGGHEVSPCRAEWQVAAESYPTRNSWLHCFGGPPLCRTPAVRCGAVRGLWLSSGAPVIRWTEGTGVLLCLILLRGHGGVHTG